MQIKKQNSTRERIYTLDTQSKRKISTRLSYTFLDILASYIISDNRNIRKKGYTNINNVMSLIDLSEYQEDSYSDRISFIYAGLEARIKHNLLNKEQVIDFIKRKCDKNKFDINLTELSNDEVNFVNNQITDILDSAEFEYRISYFEKLAQNFRDASPSHKMTVINNWKAAIKESNNYIRLNKMESAEDEIVTLRDGEFDDYARRVHREMTNPSSKLSTGMVGMNYLLNGGFESTRVYCIFGLQGEGKSTTLLNFAYQIKQYNRKYKTKDPTKRPIVVYLTLENTKKETFGRMFTLATEAGSMNKYEVDDCIDMMRHQGNLILSDDNPIDIAIKYKANNSIDTSYLYELNDDLADQGYEVIAYIVDYLNLIRSVNPYAVSEERLKLGAVVNELKAIASELDIPIITASQFNRDANYRIDEAREKGRINTISLVGRSNIGESMLILNNIDGCFNIVPEYVTVGGIVMKYLGMNLVKARYYPDTKPLNGSRVIHIPYTDPEGITLACDVGLKEPLYKLELSEAEIDLDTVIVDPNTPIPDNSNRCKDNNIIPVSIKRKEAPPIVDNEGNFLDYNPNWRELPERVEKSGISVINIDALPPEHQFRARRKIQMNTERMPERIVPDGPSRYTDEYTFIYDPYGSKEERLAYDYNMMYNKNFTEADYPMLLQHLNAVKAGRIDENILELSPYVHIEEEVHPLSVKIPEIEREVSLRHSPVAQLINSVIAR